MSKYLIWSFEHCAFWRPEWEGYTDHKKEAGKYTLDEAREIVQDARGDEIAFVYGSHPIGLQNPDVLVFDPRSVESRTITTHGTNADCPQVQNGAWDHCKGHDSTRGKCDHGVDINEVCRLCDPTVNMSPRLPNRHGS